MREGNGDGGEGGECGCGECGCVDVNIGLERRRSKRERWEIIHDAGEFILRGHGLSNLGLDRCFQ